MKIRLAKPGSSTTRAVLFPDHSGVALRGVGTIDFTCAHCGRVLAESIEPNSIFDVAVECYGCKLASDFPRLPPGAAASGYIFFPEGRYRLTETIDLPAGRLLIGVGVIQHA